MHHHSSKECHISPCIVSSFDFLISKQFEISAQRWKFKTYIKSCKGWNLKNKERERNSSSCFCHQSCHSHSYQLKSKCHYVIFVIFFQFLVENGGGDDFNQFFTRLWLFWYIVCLYSLIRAYLPPIFIWWQYIACHLPPHWVKSMQNGFVASLIWLRFKISMKIVALFWVWILWKLQN